MTTRETNPKEVSEVRGDTRYHVDSLVTASFGALDVTITDVSSTGVQFRHSDSVRLGTAGRLVIQLGENERIAVRATVVWSHLSQTALRQGLPPFASGARFDVAEREISDRLVRRLVETSRARPRENSLETKRQRLQEKLRDRRQAGVARQTFTTQIPSDQLMMINQARDRLRANPDEARKWYQRARYALAEDESRATAAPKHYREDVLAVWEYLERSIDISVIVKVFEGQLR